jgi:rfaE bifunctional protein kinase chain/domain
VVRPRVAAGAAGAADPSAGAATFVMLTTDLIEQVLATVPGRTVGVLGDLFLDRYLDIDAALNEPSLETGLTAYQVTRVRNYPGAAGTVINNLAALGVGHIYPIAFLGDDGEGYELRLALQRLAAVETAGLLTVPDRRTPTYTKPMLHADGTARELNRLDIKNRQPTPLAVQDRLLERLDQAWPRLDALLVVDQVSEDDCGVVTERVRDHLGTLAERDPAKFVLADSRERIASFRNVCLKPNERELFPGQLTGRPDRPAEAAAVQHLRQQCGARTIFVTRGERGIELFKADGSVVYCPAYRVSGPVDVCGAGDSCSAGIAAAIISGLTEEQAAAFGNLVASITVQQIGVTGTATPQQVRDRWREVG